MAQLDLFGVSRRFPSIRHLHRKDRKKQQAEKHQEKEERKKSDETAIPRDSQCTAAVAAASSRQPAAGITVAGQLYSLPAKKSAALSAVDGGTPLPSSGAANSSDTAASQAGAEAKGNSWAAAVETAGKVENSYMSLPVVKRREGKSPGRHLFRDVNWTSFCSPLSFIAP